MSHDPKSTPPKDPSTRAGRQLGIRTACLLVAVLAVWMAYGVQTSRIAKLKRRILALQPVARELLVTDPKMFAGVKLEENWYDENRWDLHIPDGRYRLCLATRGIASQDFPQPGQSREIEGGRHRISLELAENPNGWQIQLKESGAPTLVVDESREWNSSDSSAGGSLFTQSVQQRVDNPFVVFRRQFYSRQTSGQYTQPVSPSLGLMVWIEPIAAP